MRTAIGARANNPLATIRTASPGKKPSSAKRLPKSARRLRGAATETTRAAVPGAQIRERNIAIRGGDGFGTGCRA